MCQDALQTFVGILAILGIFSTPKVWEIFSENQTFVTPQVRIPKALELCCKIGL